MTPEQQREAVNLLSRVAEFKSNTYPGHVANVVDRCRSLLNSMGLGDRPPTPTVRVRAAVEINHKGYYSGNGGHQLADRDAIDSCHDCLETPGVVHFIEADIPLPQPQTIEGSVVE